ncbi:extracellular solute-binding protein [Nocardioides sp. MAHUQ-72]|uniref:extracellular solute-binding protein n=1 Tax=unclassified Nocardioides TaxID=2615069 RepID=UPI003619D629
MRRTLPALAGAAALALTLTACGGGDSKSSAETPKNSSESSVDPASLKAELTWWDTSDPANEGPVYDELIKKFNEEYPNVKIDHQMVPFGEAQSKFKTAAQSGSGAPDILRAEVAWTPEFASLGYLYALDGTPLLEDNDFLESPLSSNVFDGKTYGVPQVTDTLGLMYNKKLLDEAGVEVPTTWDELKEVAPTIKQKTGADAIALGSGGYYLLPFIYGEDGDLVDTDAKKITVNSDANVKGMQTAQDLVKSGASVKPVANDADATIQTLFQEGKVAMMINGPWTVSAVEGSPDFGGLDNLGVAPVPAGSAGQGAPVGGHNYVIYSGMSDDKAEAAIAFVKFMSSAESQAYTADKLGTLPTRDSAYDEVSNEKVSMWQDAMNVAHARPWIPEGGLFFTPLDVMGTEIMVQGQDPKKALDKAADTFKSDVVPDYSQE